MGHLLLQELSAVMSFTGLLLGLIELQRLELGSLPLRLELHRLVTGLPLAAQELLIQLVEFQIFLGKGNPAFLIGRKQLRLLRGEASVQLGELRFLGFNSTGHLVVLLRHPPEQC